MSGRATIVGECRKLRYETKGAAWVALVEAAFTPSWRGARKPVRAYYHRSCQCWHLTSKGRR